MPENEDFPGMARQIKAQFKEIAKDSVHEQLYEYQKTYYSTRFVPRALKVLYMKMLTRSEATGVTTGFSNLGLIKLPIEIENLIECLGFLIALEQYFPHFFSCVTIGNMLTLTAAFWEEWRSIAGEVMSRLEKGL